MRIKFIFLLLSILVVSSSIAQDDKIKAIVPSDFQINVAYFSTSFKPAITFGMEKTFKIMELHKFSKKGKEKIIFKERSWAMNAAYYKHKGFHANCMLFPEYIYRRIKPSGRFMLFGQAIGISRTFVDATTYSMNTDGSFKIVKTPGSFYALLITEVGFGRDYFKSIKRRPWAWYMKTGMLSLLPYQSIALLQWNWQFGVSHRLTKWKKKSNVTYRIKNKR